MRAKRIMFAVLAIGGSLSALSQGAANFADELLSLPQYFSDATFEVLLPQSLDPVTYNVTLQSEASPADSLAPCRYLIRWSTETNVGQVDGFSAYFDGNHYRYRNNRLQEYHATSNIEPFMPLGPGSQNKNGVQATAQFADMLPQYLGLKIKEITEDSSYIYSFHPDTLVSGRRCIVVDGVKRGAGYDQMAFSYVFDKDTKLPVLSEIESSPGSISEQIVTITYGKGSDKTPVEITEAGLIDTWPDVFELYRESTFRAENLVNTPLPAFACQTLGGTERYAHHLNEAFNSPVIIVVLDPSVSTTSQTINDVRDAIDTAPMDIEVIWAFTSNREEEINDALGKLRHGETALMSANQIVRNCGITLFPTTIIADRSSKVHDVIAGYNNDMGLVVLQKAMLLK